MNYCLIFFICFVFYILITNSPLKSPELWMSLKMYKVVAQLCPSLCDLWTRAHQASVHEIFQAKQHFILQDFPQCLAIFAGHLYLSEKLKLDSPYGEASICCHHAETLYPKTSHLHLQYLRVFTLDQLIFTCWSSRLAACILKIKQGKGACF